MGVRLARRGGRLLFRHAEKPGNGLQPVIGLPACHEIRTKTLPEVEEGIALLTRTLRLVNYVEPQTYMAVFYMELAQLQCGDRAAYRRDLASEKQWWNRACVTWHAQKQSF